METITLNIGGRAVESLHGCTVLEASQAAGTYVPTLCHDPACAPWARS